MFLKSQVSVLEAMSAANQWCVPDEVQDVLSVDFERSFTGLEVDLCTTSNNANSTVFAVPEISIHKEDVHDSNSHGSEKCQIDCYPVSLVHGKRVRYSQLTDIDCATKRICFNKEADHSDIFQSARCRPHNLSAPELRTTSSHFYSSGSVINTILSQVVQLPVIPTSQVDQGPPSPFQCILLAPTSISTKINEETLTYLNQGQPYEIKIKKNLSFLCDKNTLFKTIVRVGFQDRRLQYMEKEQIKEWLAQRSGERILEIDLPLSYGVMEAINSPSNTNECEFLWNPNHDIGVFLKVNCISTEFTPKKHGGEKGVPFRIVIEIYGQDDFSQKLYSAACQVKVFKPKGADRKHKTDREKMFKRSLSDKEKYHPPYDYTIFKDLSLSDSWSGCNAPKYISAGASSTPSSPRSSDCSPPNSLECLLDSPKKDCYDGLQERTSIESQDFSREPLKMVASLSYNSKIADCLNWLQTNMFGNYINDFANFNGNDLLNLTRADLIDICGAADGIRLFNTLHQKKHLTTYVRLPAQKAYSAIYLKTTRVDELISKIKSFCGIPDEYSCDFYVSGPAGTRVNVTDEVVSNMVQNSLFVIECIESSCEEEYCIFMKQINP